LTKSMCVCTSCVEGRGPNFRPKVGRRAPSGELAPFFYTQHSSKGILSTTKGVSSSLAVKGSALLAAGPKPLLSRAKHCGSSVVYWLNGKLLCGRPAVNQCISSTPIHAVSLLAINTHDDTTGGGGSQFTLHAKNKKKTRGCILLQVVRGGDAGPEKPFSPTVHAQSGARSAGQHQERTLRDGDGRLVVPQVPVGMGGNGVSRGWEGVGQGRCGKHGIQGAAR